MCKVLPLVFVASLLIVTGTCAQKAAPKITISAERIPTHSRVDVRGSGFTPKRNISSHLRKPDGTEFPVLPILADERGEFTHEIDTLLLSFGTHELWVIDDATKTSSNVARFEVTNH